MIASAKVRVKLAEFEVGLRTGSLQMTESMNHRWRQGAIGNRKILNCAGRRCAVEGVVRHLHLAHRVAFGSGVAHCWSRLW